MVIMQIFFCIICAVSFAKPFVAGKTLKQKTVIISKDGNDSAPCLTGLTEKVTSCKTLTYVFQNGNLNDTFLQIQEGIFTINNTLTLRHINRLNISGLSQTKTVLVCTKTRKSGLVFRDSQNVNLADLDIQHCGLRFETSSRLERKTVYAYTAMLVVNCKHFRLNNVAISNSSGIGIVFYDVVGRVLFEHVHIRNNIGKIETIDPNTNKWNHVNEHNFSVGGGVYIEFQPNGQSNGSTYIIRKSNFERNSAQNGRVNLISESKGKNFFSLGRGGGISFISRGYRKNNSLTLISCLFDENKALWGGGLFVEINDKSGKNAINVIDTNFTRNSATFAGGGIRVGVNSDGTQGSNTVSLKVVTFHRNSAKLGGAFSQYRASSQGQEKDKITFAACEFEDNVASIATSLHAAHLTVTLQNTSMTYSLKRYRLQKGDERQGSFYCYSSHVTLSGTNVVSGARHTAYILDYCLLIVQGTANFTGNSGINGGALALFGHSKIKMTTKSSLLLHHNKAKEKGGAIYVEVPVPLTVNFNTTQLNLYKCFFIFGDSEHDYQHADDFNTTIDFFGNAALPRGGDNIWATTIKWCRGENEPSFNNSAFKWKIIKCNGTWAPTNATVLTSPIFIDTEPKEWNASPGLPLNARVKFRDENWNEVNGTVRIQVLNSRKVKTVNPKVDFSVNEKSQIVLTGHPMDKYDVELTTMDRYAKTKIIKDRKLLYCPPGFYFNKQKLHCACQSINKGVTHCDQQTKSVYIIPSRWGDTKNNDEFATKVCPMHYCSKRENSPMGYHFNDSNQCTENRDQKSMLCSKCKDGHSVLLGSEKCSPIDTNTGILWLVLFGAVLTLLVIFFILVNFDTYSLSLNAFLFSYQVIPMLIAREEGIDDFISFIMAMINVSGTGKIQKGFQIWVGMTDMQKLLLNYLTPVYLIISTVVIGALISFFGRCWLLTKDGTYRAFVFISVICYADFTKVTFKILRPVRLKGHYYAFFAAYMRYFGNEHAPYAATAVGFLIIVVIGFPLVLLFPFLVTRYPRLVKLRGILDTFEEPFRNEPHCKKFASFYFINRFILLTIHIAMDNGPVRDVCFSISCVFMLIVFLLCKPYTNWKSNFFDGLQLTNIVVMGILFTAVSVAYDDDVRRGLNVTIWVLAYVPLLCISFNFLVWIIWKIRNRSNPVQYGHARGDGDMKFPARACEDEGGANEIPYVGLRQDQM